MSLAGQQPRTRSAALPKLDRLGAIERAAEVAIEHADQIAKDLENGKLPRHPRRVRSVLGGVLHVRSQYASVSGDLFGLSSQATDLDLPSRLAGVEAKLDSSERTFRHALELSHRRLQSRLWWTAIGTLGCCGLAAVLSGQLS